MRLVDVLEGRGEALIQQGYELPGFDIRELRRATYEAPAWVHFGPGNVFRAFVADIFQDIIEKGYDRGIIAVGGSDLEAIDKAYRQTDNLFVNVVLGTGGRMRKRVIGCVTESLKVEGDWARLVEIFQNPSLQAASLTITEKGYGVEEGDTQGMRPSGIVGRLALLLMHRFEAGAAPIALQSMDNHSHNGDVLREAILKYVGDWNSQGLAPKGFLEYVEGRVSFPWSMIDKITPGPDDKVLRALEEDGLEDAFVSSTARGSKVASFANSEETGYLVLEEAYPAGRPPLELGGVMFTDRETVGKVEQMKVCTCLNPLQTALALFGCLLGYTRIYQEMEDEDLRRLVTRMAWEEAMPVVVDPGIIPSGDFLETVLAMRLPNPFIPDMPQRIASDTSQKLGPRFGETIKAYVQMGMDTGRLRLIPLVLAAYVRYLQGVDDEGRPFTPAPDPMLPELRALAARFAQDTSDTGPLRALYTREDIFGTDLYAVGLGPLLESIAQELHSGNGAVRRTLQKYVL